MNLIVVLGAEEQAAASVAMAYPERRFLFVSDCTVVDGWDLPNVSIEYCTPAASQSLAAETNLVPLSARWLPKPQRYSLSTLFRDVDVALPVSKDPFSGVNILKGDAWHRPDAPVLGTASEIHGIVAVSGEGLLYQQRFAATETVAVVGRRWASGVVRSGAFRINQERFFRVDVLQACESIDAPTILRDSFDVLERLDHVGWFTLNWLCAAQGHRLSSLRPAPKAVFSSFSRGGLDLFDEKGGFGILHAGLKTVFVPTYGSYAPLCA